MPKLKKDGTISKQGEGGGKYKTSDELSRKLYSYFDISSKEGIRPSKAGLRVMLDIDKSTYSRYKKNPKFATHIKRAESIIEAAWVNRLDSAAATGAIFYLKNAFSEDYRDRTETDITSGGKKIQPILGGLSKKKE